MKQEGEEVSLDGIHVTPVQSASGMVQFDLNVTAINDENGLSVLFNYTNDLFNRETIKRLSRHYVEVLEQLASGDVDSQCLA
ncbi:condensation domain-containing protein, partial [Acetobacter senegalensis]|uniref:condensation domain-containing protein n=1 Tax=Acetobacter senegalensis TaxID=446692 RepID=UPI001EDAA9D3